jgi:5'-nucleotidase (lipoprotein e(P4) family)
MSRVVPAVAAIVLVGNLACAARTTVPATAAPTPPPYSTSITWVDRSAEYQALVRQTYHDAATAVDDTASGRAAGSWAVILDADETVISNLVYQQELERAGATHSAERWKAWVGRREAVPMPGARAFLEYVRTRGGRIAIVTNRLESECDDTRAVFAAHGLVHDVMLCRPDGSPSDKTPRFSRVAAGSWPGATGPLDVVMWIGDNIQDFPDLSQAIRSQGDAVYDPFGTRFFVLPNPMYGSWQ